MKSGMLLVRGCVEGEWRSWMSDLLFKISSMSLEHADVCSGRLLQ